MKHAGLKQMHGLLTTLAQGNAFQSAVVKFRPISHWIDQIPIDQIPIDTPKKAHLIARLIPGQCPFERDVVIFGRTVAHIPPLCKLNPLYEKLVELRFRALCYLADQCGEDIAALL